MPSGWSDKKKKSETHRNRELNEMSPDQLREWAEREVALAFDRESIRATHAARLDDCLRSLLSRLREFVRLDGISDDVRRKLAAAIILHEEMQERATAPQPKHK